ncbi:hypothetical protein A4X13_0g9333 [Tilletia indica]|uniref:Uncharacterized protein n=1 Tax=Tilletia indica TaxID=43049 RepID=A0A177T385_9BASI|nr:hypothetical protein A4X13_0g9333 [Tilletia indica]
MVVISRIESTKGQILTPAPLRDGDVIAFPRRRHDLKTAVRFRVEVESLELSCGVALELDMVRMTAQEMQEEEARSSDHAIASHPALSDDAAARPTVTPPAFSYADLVASRAASDPAPSSSSLTGPTTAPLLPVTSSSPAAGNRSPPRLQPSPPIFVSDPCSSSASCQSPSPISSSSSDLPTSSASDQHRSSGPPLSASGFPSAVGGPE